MSKLMVNKPYEKETILMPSKYMNYSKSSDGLYLAVSEGM